MAHNMAFVQWGVTTMGLLDTILANHGQPQIISENHNTGSINWVKGMSDPGEMIACGAYQELCRMAGEEDEAYQNRIVLLLQQLPEDHRNRIIESCKTAALRRASLEVTNGKINLVVAGKAPWHGLGVNVRDAMSAAQALQLSGTGWQVNKEQLFYVDAQGVNQPATDAFAIVRQDTGRALGTVGKRYKAIQNAEATEFLDSVIGEFGARYESAGALYAGEKVWFLVHMPKQSFTINGGDKQEPYAIFTNCHDGTGAAYCFPTVERVVCANTFRTATKERHKGLSIRHTGNIKDKIASARTALGLAVKGFETYREQAESLYNKPLAIKNYANDVLDACLEITLADAAKGADVLAAALKVTDAERDLAKKSFEKKIERRGEVLDDILSRYESERCGIGSIRGTAWAAFNAVTEHADHAKIGKQASDPVVRQSRRFESAITGDSDNMKQTAFQLALSAN
jgi:phage/plasmid-like protein (TIGR03299 family)